MFLCTHLSHAGWNEVAQGIIPHSQPSRSAQQPQACSRLTRACNPAAMPRAPRSPHLRRRRVRVPQVAPPGVRRARPVHQPNGGPHGEGGEPAGKSLQVQPLSSNRPRHCRCPPPPPPQTPPAHRWWLAQRCALRPIMCQGRPGPCPPSRVVLPTPLPDAELRQLVSASAVAQLSHSVLCMHRPTADLRCSLQHRSALCCLPDTCLGWAGVGHPACLCALTTQSCLAAAETSAHLARVSTACAWAATMAVALTRSGAR